jgi:hypothetical protein
MNWDPPLVGISTYLFWLLGRRGLTLSMRRTPSIRFTYHRGTVKRGQLLLGVVSTAVRCFRRSFCLVELGQVLRVPSADGRMRSRRVRIRRVNVGDGTLTALSRVWRSALAPGRPRLSYNCTGRCPALLSNMSLFATAEACDCGRWPGLIITLLLSLLTAALPWPASSGLGTSITSTNSQVIHCSRSCRLV